MATIRSTGPHTAWTQATGELLSLHYIITSVSILPYSLGEQTSISCATPKQSLPLFSGFGLSQVLNLVW